MSARDTGGSKPAAGAKLTSPTCPGETLTIGTDGKFEILLPRGAMSSGKIELAGSLNTVLGEWSVESDEADIGLTLLPARARGAEPAVVDRAQLALACLLARRAQAAGAPCEGGGQERHRRGETRELAEHREHPEEEQRLVLG